MSDFQKKSSVVGRIGGSSVVGRIDSKKCNAETNKSISPRIQKNAWTADPSTKRKVADSFLGFSSSSRKSFPKKSSRALSSSSSSEEEENSSSPTDSSSEHFDGSGQLNANKMVTFVPSRTLGKEALLASKRCAFCHVKGPGQHGEGNFLKSYRFANETIYVHEWCARMSPMVYIHETTGRLVNVVKEVKRGQRLYCSNSRCDKRGATMYVFMIYFYFIENFVRNDFFFTNFEFDIFFYSTLVAVIPIV